MRALFFSVWLAAMFFGSRASAQVYPLVRPMPIVIDNTDERTTSQAGPIVLRQTFTFYEFAHIDAPIHAAGGAHRTYTINPDEQLVLGRSEVWDMWSRHHTSPNWVFCSSGRNSLSRDLLGREQAWPVCLTDVGNDGTFDLIQEGRPTGGPFSPHNLDPPGSVATLTPVPYSINRDEPSPQVTIIVRYIPSRHNDGTNGLGKFRLLFLDDHDREIAIDHPDYSIPTELPATIDISGARIEVLGCDDHGLHYRLLSGMRNLGATALAGKDYY